MLRTLTPYSALHGSFMADSSFLGTAEKATTYTFPPYCSLYGVFPTESRTLQRAWSTCAPYNVQHML